MCALRRHAVGYTGVNIFPPGVDYKLLQDIKKSFMAKARVI